MTGSTIAADLLRQTGGYMRSAFTVAVTVILVHGITPTTINQAHAASASGRAAAMIVAPVNLRLFDPAAPSPTLHRDINGQVFREHTIVDYQSLGAAFGTDGNLQIIPLEPGGSGPRFILHLTSYN